MSEPVLVVHGVANHDAAQFSETVAELQARVGDRYRLIDVFWGDLGGIASGLRDALPVLFPTIETTRGASDAEGFFALLQAERQSLMGTELTRAGQDGIVDALYHSTLRAGGVATLSGTELTRGGDDDLHQALEEAIPATRYLKTLSDPALQGAVGELLAEYLKAELPADAFGQVPGEITTRGWVDDSKNAIKGFIEKVDNLIGQVVSNMAGSANQWVRGALAEPIALTFGDVVAYHQRRDAIQRRLFATLDEKAPGYGSADKPITVLAHSLGGLVAFDAALGSGTGAGDERRQLHIKRWITFGSQPAFFHVLAPREGIAHYAAGAPVSLPRTIGPWTNLWHPMDMLAFSAGTVFRLSDGRMPEDVRVDTPASEVVQNRGWLHSAYWTSPVLVAALKS